MIFNRRLLDLKQLPLKNSIKGSTESDAFSAPESSKVPYCFFSPVILLYTRIFTLKIIYFKFRC